MLVAGVRGMRLPKRLPHLEGARGRAVRTVFIVLAAISALLAFGGTVDIAVDQFRNIPVDTGYGFRTVTDDWGGNTIGDVADSARQAGLKSGDRIVAVNGNPVSATTSESEIAAQVQRAEGVVTLIIRSGESPLRRIVLHHIPGSIWTATNPADGMPVWMSAVLNFLSKACASWILLAAALLLFLRRRRDPGAMAFAFAFTLMAITTDTANWLTAYSVPVVLAFYLPMALTVSGFALFSVAVAGFPDGRFRALPTRLVPFLVLPALLLIWARVPFHPDTISSQDWFDEVMRFAAPLVPLSMVVGIVAQIIRYWRDPLTSVERQQFKWVIFAFAVTAIALIVGQYIFQTGGAASQVPGLRATYLVCGLVFPGAPALGLLVSLLRFRLYDAESAISRSVAYGALTLGLVAVFAGSEKVLEVGGEHWLGEGSGAFAAGLAAAVAAVAIAPLHHRVLGWAEHRFQKALQRLRHGLPLLVNDLRETAEPPVIAAVALARVEEGVRVARGAVVLRGDLLAVRQVEPETVRCWLGQHAGDMAPENAADPLFPLRVPLTADGVGDIGRLLLGPRPDGSLPGKDERAALAEVAEPLARALAIAQTRADDTAARLADTHALSTRVARLERMIERLTASPPGLVTE